MRTIATLFGIAAAVWVLLAIFLYLMQERLVFLSGIPGRTLETTPAALGFDYVDVNFETSDGVRLHGWYVPAGEAVGTLLFLHGNAGNISHRLDSIAIFNDLSLNVFIIDYRGYGRSEGRPGEEGTYLDAEAAWRYLVEERDTEPASILVFGRSLGGAVAAYLAAHYQPTAVIIESTFTSAADMAARLYPFMPVRRLLRLDYPVAEYVAQSNSPVLVVHSRDDEIIPYAMGREIFEKGPHPKAFLELRGDHNSAFLLDRNRYIDGLRQFIAAHAGDDDAAQRRPRK